jgi:hypothetical protein
LFPVFWCHALSSAAWVAVLVYAYGSGRVGLWNAYVSMNGEWNDVMDFSDFAFRISSFNQNRHERTRYVRTFSTDLFICLISNQGKTFLSLCL